MLKQEDKQFIVTAIAQAISPLLTRFDGLDTRIDSLDRRMENLEDEVHQQGVLLEHLNDKIDIVAENTVGLNRRVTVLEERAGIR